MTNQPTISRLNNSDVTFGIPSKGSSPEPLAPSPGDRGGLQETLHPVKHLSCTDSGSFQVRIPNSMKVRELFDVTGKHLPKLVFGQCENAVLFLHSWDKLIKDTEPLNLADFISRDINIFTFTFFDSKTGEWRKLQFRNFFLATQYKKTFFGGGMDFHAKECLKIHNLEDMQKVRLRPERVKEEDKTVEPVLLSGTDWDKTTKSSRQIRTDRMKDRTNLLGYLKANPSRFHAK